MKKGFSVFLALFFFGIGAAPAQEDSVVVSGLPNYAPFMWAENNTLKGIAAELTERVFEELGVDYAFRVLPWKRAQQEAAAGRVDLIAGIYRNAEREKYLIYSKSFMVDPGVLFVRAGHAFDYRQRSDLIGKLGVTNRGYSWGEPMDRFIEEKLDMIYVETPKQAFRMLLRNDRDVEYYFFGLIPGLIVLKRLELEDRIECLPAHVTKENFYYGFSKHSRHKDLLPGVNQAVERLKGEGYLDSLREKYIEHCSSNSRPLD